MLLIILGLIALAAAYVAYDLYRYTSSDPVAIPRYEPKQGEAKAVESRLESFEKSLKAEKSAAIELTAADLNALVAGTEEGKRYAGKVFFRVEGDEVLADVSLPLSELKRWGIDLLTGRYLNGTLSFKAGEKEGKPTVVIDRITAGGRQMPETYLSHIRDRNLLKELPATKALEALQEDGSIAVEDGKIIILK
jgi:hypothetical protein